MSTTTLPRCGDHVRHLPSGENMLVAWAEGDDLAPAGWPNRMVRVADCEITHRCGDLGHVKAVCAWAEMMNDSRADRVMRLYGSALTSDLRVGLAQQEPSTTEAPAGAMPVAARGWSGVFGRRLGDFVACIALALALGLLSAWLGWPDIPLSQGVCIAIYGGICGLIIGRRR